MIERLETIKKRFTFLSEELTKESIISDYKHLSVLSKERSDLELTVTKYEEYLKLSSDITSLEEMIKLPEYATEARDELTLCHEHLEALTHELEILLIPKDENDDKDVIFEIRGAAGGDEANIFAGDLFRMYAKYAEKNGWKIEMINEVIGTSGGYCQVEFIMRGENVYSKLKYESGSHRVQRVPETETQGRVHTSTATVLVMHEIGNLEVDIKESDLKIDVYHSGGAGGQSVNTTNSAVRITHVPTGIVVTCQNERSQMKNKDKAMEILKVRIYDDMAAKKESEFSATRKNKIGTGDRSEKIRTYNYPQNRVTDHRIDYSIMDLTSVMDGYLEPIIEKLIAEDQRLKLEGN